MASGHAETKRRKHNATKGAQGNNDTEVLKERGHASCLVLSKYVTGFTTEKLSSNLRMFWVFFPVIELTW